MDGSERRAPGRKAAFFATAAAVFAVMSSVPASAAPLPNAAGAVPRAPVEGSRGTAVAAKPCAGQARGVALLAAASGVAGEADDGDGNVLRPDVPPREPDYRVPMAYGVVLRFHGEPDHRESRSIIEYMSSKGLVKVREQPSYDGSDLSWVFNWSDGKKNNPRFWQYSSAWNFLKYPVSRPAAGFILLKYRERRVNFERKLRAGSGDTGRRAGSARPAGFRDRRR